MKNHRAQIHLHNIHLPKHSDHLDAYWHILTDTERKRAEKFRKPADGNCYILSRGILRQTLADCLDSDPAELVFQHNENGKPFLPGCTLEFNLSHSRDRLLIAVTETRAVGVDIEFRRDGLPITTIAERWFAPTENEFFQRGGKRRDAFFDIWAKKEAFVKARGEGIFCELNSFAIPLSSDQDGPPIGKADGWGFQSLEIDPAYSAALVWKQYTDDNDPPEVLFL